MALSSFYGVGMGQVPGHLAPESATTSSGNVTAVTNLGGAGAALNATKQGSGNIALTNGQFVIAAGTSPYLMLANPGDLLGTRLYMVAGIDQSSVGNLNIAGHSVGTAAGQRTNIQWVRSSNTLRLLRWNGASFEARDLALGEAIGPTLRLIEVEIGDNNVIRCWLDGELRSTATNIWPDFIVSRLFAGYNSPYFSGPATDLLWMITDGTQDAAGAQVRQELATRNGITVPGSATTHTATAAVASASTVAASSDLVRRRAVHVASASTIAANHAAIRARGAAVASGSVLTAAYTVTSTNTASANIASASTANASAQVTRGRAASVAASSTVGASYTTGTTKTATAAVAGSSAAAAVFSISRGRTAAVSAASAVAANATTSAGTFTAAAVQSVSTVSAQAVRILRRDGEAASASNITATRRVIVSRPANVEAASAVIATAAVGAIVRRHAYPGESRGGRISTNMRGGTIVHTARSGTIQRG